MMTDQQIATAILPYLRELRFGPPKVKKTTAVVMTYPGPMLVLNFQPGGLDSVTRSMTVIQRETLDSFIKAKPNELPEVTVINYTEHEKISMLTHKPTYSGLGFNQVGNDINKLTDTGCCPFKTVVFDPLTEFSRMLVSFIGSLNMKGLSMDDARAWAGAASQKTVEVVGTLYSLPCNAVVIAHEQTEKIELTGEIKVLPMCYGASREVLGSMAAQYLYATSKGQGPDQRFVVWTKPQGWVKGIGVRWIRPVAEECGPTYQEIYGA